MCVVYHFGKINFGLDSPLLISIVKDRNASDYGNIIQFFNINGRHIPVEKIRNLWRFIHDMNKDSDCEVATYFIGKNYRWLGFFDEINDEIKGRMLLFVQNFQSLVAS